MEKLKICLQLTSSFPAGRTRTAANCTAMKKRSFKSPKSAVLHGGMFELETFLLPLSSWLL